ncbi:MAG: glycosyltransferase family 4 protein, partial [Ruegeria sp.]
DLVSGLRIYDKSGDPSAQQHLRDAAGAEVERLISDLPADIDVWVTYHNYYKAPDLLGPQVCRARGIPYVQLESTRATSRLTGPWAGFAQSAHDACDAAQVIFYHTANDLITLERERFGNQDLIELPPFLPLAELPPPSSCDGPMLTVGMMRQGDKLQSYKILAQALALLQGDWSLTMVGDGPARGDVETLMAPFGDHVRMLGELDRDTLQKQYQQASLFVWPGVNEAYGMVYLEAQAAGVPVVAQNRPGVRDVLRPADHSPVEEGAQGLARQMTRLIGNAALCRAQGAKAREYIAQRHLITSATETFWNTVRPLIGGRT